jgi:16S rRNA (guanine966-N2)-methyltransferase
VIAGELRGRRVVVPRTGDVRPTYDRVRESVFGIIDPLLDGARVLDLFAGSGVLGIEALSRGAASATFV